MQFNPGDRVECLRGAEDRIHHFVLEGGKTYTVIMNDSGYLNLKELPESFQGWCSTRFKLVSKGTMFALDKVDG